MTRQLQGQYTSLASFTGIEFAVCKPLLGAGYNAISVAPHTSHAYAQFVRSFISRHNNTRFFIRISSHVAKRLNMNIRCRHLDLRCAVIAKRNFYRSQAFGINF